MYLKSNFIFVWQKSILIFLKSVAYKGCRHNDHVLIVLERALGLCGTIIICLWASKYNRVYLWSSPINQ